MTTTTTTGVVVSAPGKMLLAGGYLVLDASNAGLVVAVDKRFYAECCIISCKAINATEPPNANHAAKIPIAVRSPQFGATWRYAWDPARGILVVRDEDAAEPTAAKKGAVENSSKNTSNPFVEKALRVALLYLLGEEFNNSSIINIRSLQITIAADNDFYSLVPHLRARGVARPTLQPAQQLPLRLPVARQKGEKGGPIYKTGLGSSACLVTAVTGSLVHAVRRLRSSTVEEENDDAAATQLVIARLAQIGHCHAQGKVGSGFDVSAACYGSHVYRRFSPALLEPLLVRLDDSSSDDSLEKNQDTARLLRELVDGDDKAARAEWSGVQAGIRNFHGSKSFLQCMMADVSGGSESPSMAKAVLQWRRKQQQQSADGSSCPHWDDLATLNPQIVALLQQLETATANLDDDVLATLQQQLVDTRPDDWSCITASSRSGGGDGGTCTAPSAAATVPVVAQLLAQLHTAFVQARRHLKAMGVAAGVPIEPDAQTALCDACRQVPGVVAALVPGAGGHDAVACVYINTAAVRQAVADLWADWKGQDGSEDQTVGALTVQGADFGEGVRVEPAFPSLAVDDGTAPNESDT